MKNSILILLLCAFVAINATAQNTDNEKLQNAKHALDAYNDCQTALNNLNDMSAAAQKEKDYLLYMGKAYECKGDNEQALSYYNKILAADPNDQTGKDRIAFIQKQKQEKEQKENRLNAINAVPGIWHFKTPQKGNIIEVEIVRKNNSHYTYVYEFEMNPNHKYDTVLRGSMSFSFIQDSSRRYNHCDIQHLNMAEVYPEFAARQCNSYCDYQDWQQYEPRYRMETSVLFGHLSFKGDYKHIEVYLPKIRLVTPPSFEGIKGCAYEPIEGSEFLAFTLEKE